MGVLSWEVSRGAIGGFFCKQCGNNHDRQGVEYSYIVENYFLEVVSCVLFAPFVLNNRPGRPGMSLSSKVDNSCRNLVGPGPSFLGAPAGVFSAMVYML